MNADVKIAILRALLFLAAFAAAWLLCAGCASKYQLGRVRDDMRNGDRALWRDRKFLDERIHTLEMRVYHLERGERLERMTNDE